MRAVGTMLLWIFWAIACPARADEWIMLFDGKDTKGWRANLDPDSFRAENGVLRIQATGKTSAHLFYVGDRKEGLETFRNFELEAVVKAEPNSNGGIFVHTDESTRDAAKHLAEGYEIQLNSSVREKRKTGSLYAIVDLPESPVDETEWFTVRVKVVDKRIVIHVNDRKTVDYVEPADAKRPPERAGRLFSAEGGAIALQAHDRNSVWYFKEIRIKRLP